MSYDNVKIATAPIYCDGFSSSPSLVERKLAYDRYLFVPHYKGWIYWKQIDAYWKQKAPDKDYPDAFLH